MVLERTPVYFYLFHVYLQQKQVSKLSSILVHNWEGLNIGWAG